MNNVSKFLLTSLLLATTIFSQDVTGVASALKHEARLQKRQIIALNISFQDSSQSQSFWNIYDDFEKQSAVLTDRSIELIKEYATNYATMTGDEAAKLTAESMAITEGRQKLLKKTYKKVAKISKLEAARFVQIENRINLMVRYASALDIPVLMSEEDMKAPMQTIEIEVVPAPTPVEETPTSTVEESTAVEEPAAEESTATPTAETSDDGEPKEEIAPKAAQ